MKQFLKDLFICWFIPACLVSPFLLIVAGCDGKSAAEISKDKAEISKDNQEALQSPQIVGLTEDGKVVKCYAIDGPNGYTHYIYSIGGNSVTVNRQIQVGKTTRTQTVVTIIEDVGTNTVK